VGAEGSIAAFVWRFEPGPADRPPTMTREALFELSQTDASRSLAKELKRRGWSFVGPTTAYAFMQAMGLVNDHLEGCDARSRVEARRATLTRPS
jgi:DNA-3-methyladenine glycosylase I